jgi:integrase
VGDARSVSLAKAAKVAQSTLTEVQVEDRDPHAERTQRRTEALTFADLFKDWYERHAEPKLARAELDQTIYKHHLEDDFARQVVTEIKRIEIGRLRDKIAKASGTAGSDNVLVLINRVFNWALNEGIVEFNPASRLPKAGRRRPRARVLSAEEIRKFWRGLAAMELLTGEHMGRGETGRMLTPGTRSILRLLLLTGQRRGEVSGIEKSELYLKGSEPIWTIPGARTKNRLLHRVPLTPMAVEEFERALSFSPHNSAYVFARQEVEADAHILPSSITRAMSRMTGEIGITGASPHDLRRTVGTELARLRVPREVRSLVFNHSPKSSDVTDAVYNRYAYDNEKREALSAWEKHLSAILAGREAGLQADRDQVEAMA